MDTNFKNSVLKDLNILYIEDEENIRKNISTTLQLLVSTVFAVATYDEAISAFNQNKIDIIISDINLPGKSGIDFCKDIRINNIIVPIVLLTAHLDTHYLLDATKLKLVDYLIKPINFKTLHTVLIKCVDELLEQNMFKIRFMNSTEFDLHMKLLMNEKNEEIKLTSSELHLLEYLIKHSHRVIPHEEIKTHIWEVPEDVSDSALKNLLNKLRKKIGKDSIDNISGIGFRLIYKH